MCNKEILWKSFLTILLVVPILVGAWYFGGLETKRTKERIVNIVQEHITLHKVNSHENKPEVTSPHTGEKK